MNQAAPIRRIEQLSLVVTFASIMAGTMVVPLWLSAVMAHFEVGSGTVGLIASLEFAGIALTSLAMALRRRQVNPVRLCQIGLTLGVVGSGLAVAACFSVELGLLIGARFMVGCGAGLVVAGVNRTAARTPRPERTFALLNVGIAVTGAVLFLVIPHAIGWLGPAGGFLVQALPLLLGLALSGRIPEISPLPGAAEARRLPVSRNSALVLVGLTLFFLGHNGCWTFAERIGLGVGLDAVSVGMALSLAAAVTLLGPLTSYALGLRLGSAVPLAASMGALVVLVYILTNAGTPTVFVGAIALFPLMPMFVTPYLMGLLAYLDRSGRLAVAAFSFVTCGAALGPAVSGMSLTVLNGSGFAPIGWVAMAAFAGTFALIFPVARRVDRARRSGAGAIS